MARVEIWELWKCEHRDPSPYRSWDLDDECARFVYREPGEPAPSCPRNHGPMKSKGLYEMEAVG